MKNKNRMFAALALSACIALGAVGFAACGDKDNNNNDKDDNTQTAQPNDGNQGEEAVDEAVTEEQWKILWEEAKNLNHSGTIKGTQTISDSSSEIDCRIAYLTEKDWYMEKMYLIIDDEPRENNAFYEFKETEIIQYAEVHSTNVETGYDTISWYSASISAENYFFVFNCAYPGILLVPLRKTEEGADINFSDCYDIATYNETTKQYELQAWIKIGTSDMDHLFAFANIQIKIVDGQLSELTIAIQDYSNYHYNISEMVINYKFGVEIDLAEYKIPDEVLANN